MSNILEVDNLHVSFDSYDGEIEAVRGVSLNLKKGETLAIVGESGSGKSVMCKSLMKLNPTGRLKDAKIMFEGKDIASMSEKQMRKIRGTKISMVFQDPMTSLNPTMPIGKQIIESMRYHDKITKTKAIERARELLRIVGITNVEQRMKEYPHQFSGGMRQRVVIAIALSCYPDILIADEPTTALDVTIQAQILDLLDELKDKFGMSIVFITHDLAVVSNIADRVAVMYAGKIVEVGKVEEIFKNPQHPYTWGLLGSIPTVDGKEEELMTIAGSPPNLLNIPQGDAFAKRNDYALEIDYVEHPPMFKVSDTHYAATWLLHEQAPKVERPEFNFLKKASSEESTDEPEVEEYSKDTILKVENLKIQFGSKENLVKAVDDITLDVKQGETLGIVGESGSGKSTLGRAILGLYKPTEGTVYYDGKDVNDGKGHKREDLAQQMQMIFQDPYSSINPRMTVADIIAEGLDIHKLAENPKQRMQRIQELLEEVGLNKEHANRYPHEFSGGQRQRVGIARALAVNPKFIIADEPISALDVSVQAQVINLLKKLQNTNNLTYMFITHDLSMARYISDRIGVMYQGKIVEMAKTDVLFSNPLHSYTKSLLSAIPLPDLEQQKTKRVVFDKEKYHSAEPLGRKLREVAPGHLVECTEKEFAHFKEIYK